MLFSGLLVTHGFMAFPQEETKDFLRKRKRKPDTDHDNSTAKQRDAEPKVKTARKQVSFV